MALSFRLPCGSLYRQISTRILLGPFSQPRPPYPCCFFIVTSHPPTHILLGYNFPLFLVFGVGHNLVPLLQDPTTVVTTPIATALNKLCLLPFFNTSQNNFLSFFLFRKSSENILYWTFNITERYFLLPWYNSFLISNKQ